MTQTDVGCEFFRVCAEYANVFFSNTDVIALNNGCLITQSHFSHSSFFMCDCLLFELTASARKRSYRFVEGYLSDLSHIYIYIYTGYSVFFI